MSKKLLLLASVFAVMFTAPLSVSAQVPLATATPEGTTITNSASVGYTDANGNTYSNATASVSITVGFAGFIDVTGTSTYTPSSPSSGNQAVFTINNNGNGIDSVTVSTATSTGVTITGYIYNSTNYASLALLNAALAGAAIPRTTGSINVTVVYTVGSLYGGQTIPLSLTATSRRDTNKTDTQTDNISPPVAGGVSVTANVTSVNRLPGGAGYTTTFNVSNGANASRTFTLSGGSSNTGVVTFGTITGGTTVTIPGNSSATITVSYTVLNVAAGSTSNVTLTATANDDNLITGTGTHAVTVIKANLTLTKEAYRADKSTPITSSPTDLVIPGEDVWYKLTITNNGAAAAAGLSVTDVLPATTTYVANTVTATGSNGTWNVVNSSGTITATLTGTLPPSASDVIWVRVTVK